MAGASFGNADACRVIVGTAGDGDALGAPVPAGDGVGLGDGDGEGDGFLEARGAGVAGGILKRSKHANPSLVSGHAKPFGASANG